MTEKFRFSVAKIMDSWFEDTDIKSNSGRYYQINNRKNLKEKSCISSQRTVKSDSSY